MGILSHKELERVLKAFANKRRLAIMQLIQKKKEISVGGIATEIHLSLKATSKHLAILAGANILEREQRGTQMFYRLASDISDQARKIASLI